MATFKVYRDRSGTKRYGVLSGGATKDYSVDNPARFYSETEGVCTDTRPWGDDHTIPKSFQTVRVAADVTGIGDWLFAWFEYAHFVFENAANIEHLGERAFSNSGISGSLSLPGLKDTTLGTAFSGCVDLLELSLEGSAVTQIGKAALSNCFALRKVSGCGNIRVVADRAFVRCTSLTDIDLNKAAVERIGSMAFHISGIGSLLDDYDESVFKDDSGNSAVGTLRKHCFDENALQDIRTVQLSDIGGEPPYGDEQQYCDTLYCLRNGEQMYITDGCVVLALYHAYQSMTGGGEFKSFGEFWTEIDTRCYNANGKHIHEYQFGYGDGDVFKTVVDLLGLQLKDYSAHELRGNKDTILTWNAQALQEILEALRSGYGVTASITTKAAGTSYTTDVALENGTVIPAGTFIVENTHAVAIVGIRDGKLLVADSTHVNGEDGAVYAVAYEDLFVGEKLGMNCVRVLMPKEVSA